MSATLAQMRTYLEEITHTSNDATFPGGAYELQLLNKAYQKSAYKFDWPHTMKRWFDPIVANVDRYALQADFRKFRFLYSQGAKLEETDMEYIIRTYGKYAVTLDTNEYILGSVPTTTTPVYNISGTVAPGSAVTVTLDTIDGISAGDEIFIADSTLSEFTKVQSVGTLNIVVKLVNSHTSKPLYRTTDGNYFQEQKIITDLSAVGDLPILPADTHLVIPHYAAHLYYKDIQEDDEAATHLNTWNEEISDAWMAFDKLSAGAVGEFRI